MTINIDSILELHGDTPLFCQYGGQYNPQSAYLYLDENGNVSADYDPNIGGGMGVDVWHGRTIRWSLPWFLSAQTIIKAVKGDLLPLLKRVHEGHDDIWDGNNYVGRLTCDAEIAKEEIEAYLSDWRFSHDDLLASQERDETNY